MVFHSVQTDDEAKALAKLAREVFGPGSGIIVPRRPKWAIYATDESGQMIGGVILKRLGQTVAMVDFIFVARNGRGRGLGPQLLDRGLAALEEAGCTRQLALIREDNTPSWNMFATRGFTVPSIFTALFGFSLQAFGSVLLAIFALNGYSIWARDSASASPATGAGREPGRVRMGGGLPVSILFAALVGLGIGSFGLRGPQWLLSALTLVLGLSLVRLVVSFPFARVYGPVRLTLSHGGAIVTLIQMAFGAWWPHFGFWAPQQPLWHLSSYRRHLGRASFAGWLVTIGAFAATFFISPPELAGGLRGVMVPMMIYQAVPYFPFEGMDGYRVFRWSRLAYFLGLGATVFCLVYFLV